MQRAISTIGKYSNARIFQRSICNDRNFSSLKSSIDNDQRSANNTKSENYFTILKLGDEPKFTINEKELKAVYKTLMTDFHPDRVMNRSDGRTADDLHEMASAVTRAYDVISKPHLRAMYLLDILGMPINENDSGDLVGSEFLMEVMMVREQVDDATNDEQRAQLLRENTERIQSCCIALDLAVEEVTYSKAKRLAAELQYWNRVENTIKENMSDVR